MIRFVQGNLLDADVEALVNTVNTVGIMGKGIALMFKDKFPENTKAYESACKKHLVDVGKMFVCHRNELIGPTWIVNFPTKKHWRNPSRIEWIESGLEDLKKFIIANKIKSIALPPLGSGNGGLAWQEVKLIINGYLKELIDIDILVFEPTKQYQNVMKRDGVEKLTPARALIAELVRRYWILGFECSFLEAQKLAYLLEECIVVRTSQNPLDLRFSANRYGPYAPRLMHLLNGLDGSYLHCGKRIADADVLDVVWFDDSKRDKVTAYLTSPEVNDFRFALEETTKLIDGFESPLGMELIATVHWTINRLGAECSYKSVIQVLREWPGGEGSGERKQRLFDQRLIELALNRLSSVRSNIDV